MKKSNLIYTILILFMGFQFAFAQEKSETSMFPEPKKNHKQYIIKVPKQKDESQYKVEIIVGKREKVDNCNQHRLSGQLESKDLSGWGYTYYEFETKGHIMSTMMACPDSKSVEKLITAPSELTRYNSKLPIVIYAPDGYEVTYKIWSASKKSINVSAEKK